MKKVFVHNIDYNVRQEDIEAEFSRYGKILRFDIPQDRKKNSHKG